MPDINLNSLGSLKTSMSSQEPGASDTQPAAVSSNAAPLWLAAIEAMKKQSGVSAPKKMGMPIPPGIGAAPAVSVPAVAVPLAVSQPQTEKPADSKPVAKSGPKISLSGLWIGAVGAKPAEASSAPVSVPVAASVSEAPAPAVSLASAPVMPKVALWVSAAKIENVASSPVQSAPSAVVSTSIFAQSSSAPITKTASASVSLTSFVQSGQEMDANEALKAVQAAPAPVESVSIGTESVSVFSSSESSSAAPAATPAPAAASASSIAIDLGTSETESATEDEAHSGVAELFPNFTVVDKELEADIEQIETEERTGGKPKKESAFSLLKKTFVRSSESQGEVESIPRSEPAEAIASEDGTLAESVPSVSAEATEVEASGQEAIAAPADGSELQPVMSESADQPDAPSESSDASASAESPNGLTAERASEADTMNKAREWMQQWFTTVRPGSIEKMAEASAARRKKIIYSAIPLVLLSASAITAFNFLDHSGQKPTISVVENHGSSPVATPVANDPKPSEDPAPVSQDPKPSEDPAPVANDPAPVVVAPPEVIETPIVNTKPNPGARELRLQAWIDAGLDEAKFNALFVRRNAEWKYYVPETTIAEYAQK